MFLSEFALNASKSMKWDASSVQKGTISVKSKYCKRKVSFGYLSETFEALIAFSSARRSASFFSLPYSVGL